MVPPDDAANDDAARAPRLRNGSPPIDRAQGDDQLDAGMRQP
jgi:hypothetical protein